MAARSVSTLNLDLAATDPHMETGIDTPPHVNGESPFPYGDLKKQVPISIRGSPYGNGDWHILDWKRGIPVERLEKFGKKY